MKVSALFVRRDSPYKTMPDVDCWDADRDALRFNGTNPVIAHPPCRAWGVLSHMANPRPGEKECAIWAVEVVRRNGGVLEHPHGSKLWKYKSLPQAGSFLPDEFGGFTVEIDQYWFGHVANKPTKLYICGCRECDLPPIPFKEGKAFKTICGIKGQPGRRCTQYEREFTPTALREWLVETACKCGAAKAVPDEEFARRKR